MNEEAKKILSAGFIREVQYTTRLANVVIVKKSNEKWRMCINYTYLKKAYPKGSYPLLSIDHLIDEASRFPILNFLNVYFGNNQISMFKQDKEKISFMTDTTNYCYSIMLFNLMNVRTTYQKMMDKIFINQLKNNIEVM